MLTAQETRGFQEHLTQAANSSDVTQVEHGRAMIEQILTSDRRQKTLLAVLCDCILIGFSLWLLSLGSTTGAVIGLLLMPFFRLLSEPFHNSLLGRYFTLRRIATLERRADISDGDAVRQLVVRSFSARRFEACTALQVLGSLADSSRVQRLVTEVVANRLHAQDGFVRQAAAESMMEKWSSYEPHTESIAVAKANYPTEGVGELAGHTLDLLREHQVPNHFDSRQALEDFVRKVAKRTFVRWDDRIATVVMASKQCQELPWGQGRAIESALRSLSTDADHAISRLAKEAANQVLTKSHNVQSHKVAAFLPPATA